MHFDVQDQATGYESGHGQHSDLIYCSKYNKQKGLQTACMYL